MRIYYKNSKGQIIDFTGLPYRILESDLYDYEWAYETRKIQTNKIYWFHKDITEKTIKVSVSANSQKLYEEYGNRLLSVFEYDIINLTPGQLYVNDMYISCYFYKSKKSDWKPGVSFLINEFSVVSESGKWIKVEHQNFNATIMEEFVTGKGLDFPYDYPYDYANGAVNKALYNNSFVPCDFEMTICGSCSNPIISIGEVSYEINADIAVGEYLKVNTLKKKIYKVKVNGEQVNLFHYRNRERTNFFEKIPPGKHTVLWNGSYTFDIDLFYERSEPVWI